jgi:hypothetical protein
MTPLTYKQASQRAAIWVAAAAVAAVVASYVLMRSGSDYEERETFKRGVLLGLAGLPVLAGAVHRSVRVLGLAALFEAVLLAGLIGLTRVEWREWF